MKKLKKLPSPNTSFWEVDCTFRKTRRREKAIKKFNRRRRIKKKQIKLLNYHFDLFGLLLKRAKI